MKESEIMMRGGDNGGREKREWDQIKSFERGGTEGGIRGRNEGDVGVGVRERGDGKDHCSVHRQRTHRQRRQTLVAVGMAFSCNVRTIALDVESTADRNREMPCSFQC